MGKDEGRIGLQELLAQLRKELLAAEENIEPGKALLKVEGVEVDLSVVTEKNVQGGVQLWVVNVGGKYGAQETHTIKLTLVPVKPIEAAVK
jgi:Trypsin-co-occurring domain 2